MVMYETLMMEVGFSIRQAPMAFVVLWIVYELMFIMEIYQCDSKRQKNNYLETFLYDSLLESVNMGNWIDVESY